MLAIAILLSLAGQDRESSIVPRDDRVEPAMLAPLTEIPTEDIMGGTYSVLVDTQIRVLDGEVTASTDLAWYVHDTQGVQNGSQVSNR